MYLSILLISLHIHLFVCVRNLLLSIIYVRNVEPDFLNYPFRVIVS